MGIGLIIAGLFFVFNPYVGVIDVIPDLIGYLLIFAGTAKLSMLNADASSSRKYFGSMLWISAARLAAALLIMRFNDGFLSLTLTILAGVADSVYAIRAFSLLFSALGTMSCMAGEMKISPDGASQFTPFAVIAKNALAAAPEFTVLSAEDGLGNMGLIAYRSMFTLICVIVSLVIGSVWLVLSVRYLSALSRGGVFVPTAEARYNAETASDPYLFLRLDLTAFIRLLPLPLLFLLQINFDGYYIVPEFFCPALLIILLCRIKKHVNVRRAVCFCAASAAVLALKYVMLLIYSEKFSSYAYPYEAEGFLIPYLSYLIPAAAGYLLLAFAYAGVYRVVGEISDFHTGERPGADERLAELNSRVSDELKKRYRLVTVLISVLLVLLAASSAAAAFFNMGYVVCICFDAAVIFITYSFCSELVKQVSRRYT